MKILVGDESVVVEFYSEGHTRDNVVVYVHKEKAIFGGCLIKSLDATKGYLGDANVPEWPHTVSKIREKYPDLKVVIPGHGEYGGIELLDYTIQLFQD